MSEIARLVEAVFEDKQQSTSDLSQRLRSDPALKLGFEKLYLILKDGVEPIGDGKLGIECWDQSKVQAVCSIAFAIARNTRSIPVEHAEPIIVAVVEKSMEFGLSYLEKSNCTSDDLSVQKQILIQSKT